METEKEPLILVFYIYRDVLAQKDIRDEYINGVKKHFEDIKIKATFFFLPTDTEERIECLNPRFIEDQNEVEKLKRILEDVEKRFEIDTKSTDNVDED
jgi:hypothetical protein